jgi:putative ABC transport system permease protein
VPTLELTDSELEQILFDYEVSPEDAASLTTDDLIKEYKVDTVRYLEERIGFLETRYHFSAELFCRKYIKSEGTVWYINTLPEKINMISTLDGEEPTASNEVLLSYQYAKHNNLSIGDTITINSKELIVCGLFTQASESLIYNSKYSTSMNTTNNAVAIVTEEAYKEFPSDDEDVSFCAVFSKPKAEAETNDLITEMMDDSAISFVANSSKLPMFNSLLSNFSTSLTLMAAGVLLILITILIMTMMLINNWFKGLQKSYGVLLGMGYSKTTLAGAFSVVSIPVSVGLVLGVVLGFFMSQGFVLSYCDVFNILPPHIDIFTLSALVAFINVVLVVFSVFVTTKCLLLLNKDVLSLMLNRSSERANTIIQKSKAVFEKASINTRIKTAYILKHTSRFFAIMLVSVFAIILSIFSIAIFSLSNEPLNSYADELAYDSIVTYATEQNDSSYENQTETFMQGSFYAYECEGTKINAYYNILSLDAACNSLQIVDANKQPLVPIEEGCIVVSAKFANQYGVERGNKLTIRSSDGTSTSFTVSGINSINYDINFYVDSACKESFYAAEDSNSFNGEFINGNAEPYNNEGVAQTKSQKLDDIKGLLSGSMAMIPILILLTIFLVAGISCLISYLNINESKKDIVVFSILGYKDRSIFNLVVNIYAPAVLCGCLLGSLLAQPILAAFQTSVNTTTEVLITLQATVISSLLMVAAVFFLYNLIINTMMASVKRINSNEVLYD